MAEPESPALRQELERIQEQLRNLSATLANQQSVYVDIAGARTAELRTALSGIEGLAGGLRGETERLHQLQDAISHHLHDLVLDVIQPELRAQLSRGLPRLMMEAMAPELRQALGETLPEAVGAAVTPEVRRLLSEWLPVMVADSVAPEVRQAIAERLPDITAAAVQPELRRVLAERLPHLVADTVQPELYRTLADRLPGIVGDAVTPAVRDAVLAQLPHLVSETVRPEVREALDQRLPGVVAQVVSPELRRVLAERLPHLVAETVQPELRQVLTDHLPHLVAEAVQPEVRETLDARLPGVVAQIVSPEVRRVLAERLPHLVADTVQPELRQVLLERLPGIVAESVGPSVGALLAERVPGMLAEAVTPELSVTLAEMEGAAAELRHEAAKLRSLREVVAERLPDSVMGAVEPHLQEILAVRFPRLVAELVDPVLRQVLTDQLPGLVAAAVQPDVSRSLSERVPELVAEAVRPELRQIVYMALEARLPQVVAEAVRPELRQRLSETLGPLVAEVMTPELAATVTSALPALFAETVSPDLSVSLAEIEAAAAEMRAETARLRGVRDVVTERLPQAVMGAVQTVLDETIATRLPELLAEMIRPALQEAVALPLPATVNQFLEPALRNVLVAELPGLVQSALEHEVRQTMAESLPALIASSTEPSVRAALDRVEASALRLTDVREQVIDRLSALAQEALVAPLAEFQSSTTDYQAEAALLGALRGRISTELPALVAEAAAAALSSQPPTIAARDVPAIVQDALAISLTDVEATAAQLRTEAQRLGSLRQDVARELPGMVADAVVAALANHATSSAIAPGGAPAVAPAMASAMASMLSGLEASAGELKAEADRLRTLRHEMARELPRMVVDAVAAADVSELRGLREQMVGELPRLVQTAVAAALAQTPEAPARQEPPSTPAPAAEPDLPPRDQEIEQRREGQPTLVAPWAQPAPPAEPAPEPTVDAPEPERAVSEAMPAPEEPPAEPVDRSLAAALAPSPPSPAASAGPRPADAAEGTSVLACVLPGVVVGPTLARGISGAASRARLRRRRRRRAGPPSAGLHRRDPFGSELTQRLEWFALANRQTPNGAAAMGSREPGSVPAGERDGLEVSVPLGRLGGLCILGPRSREVTRAIVLSFLAEHGHESGRAIVVGDLFASTSTFPGLGRARDIGAVLGGLQAEATRRRTLFAGEGVSDIAGYRAKRPDDPLPIVLMAASELSTPDAARLAPLLDDGAGLGIVGVLADIPLDGVATLRLQGSGQVASATPEAVMDELVGARLFAVEKDPARELLEVLASARIDVDDEQSAQPANQPFQAVPSESAAISVHLFGTYRLAANGREVRAGLRAKARELLAFYLLHPEGTTLEEATEALWPEADPRRGSEWFWTALGNLRSRLRSATENPELKVIEREGDRYRIEALFDVDLWRFESALDAVSSQSGDPTWAESLQATADLYGGELLAGTDWPWADVPREDLRGRAVDVLVSLAATRLVGGDVQGALAALERAVEVDPLAEQLYRRIMRLHAKLARPDRADATFRALQARLGEHHFEPSPESAKLHEELCGTA